MTTYKWYCLTCDWYTNDVSGEEDNDPRHTDCGCPVEIIPDPQYNHTGHDPPEEKALGKEE